MDHISPLLTGCFGGFICSSAETPCCVFARGEGEGSVTPKICAQNMCVFEVLRMKWGKYPLPPVRTPWLYPPLWRSNGAGPLCDVPAIQYPGACTGPHPPGIRGWNAVAACAWFGCRLFCCWLTLRSGSGLGCVGPLGVFECVSRGIGAGGSALWPWGHSWPSPPPPLQGRPCFPGVTQLCLIPHAQRCTPRWYTGTYQPLRS